MKKKISEKSRTKWYFLLVVVLAYFITAIVNQDFLKSALDSSRAIFLKILPIFALVFAIMFMINYFITPRALAKYLAKNKGAKAWGISIIAGIISTGPIYMWYPLLAELKENGTREGLIAAFLYARAIKPALIPLMIFYFGLSFTIVLTIAMIVFSVIQGKTLEKIMEVKTK